MNSYLHNRIWTDLQVTGEQSGSSGFRQHSDLLERQQVMDMDVVLCGEITVSWLKRQNDNINNLFVRDPNNWFCMCIVVGNSPKRLTRILYCETT